MLRVGLTGELGSGKSTVAGMLAAHGAIVLSSDEMGRRMMQPGEGAYARIVERFGRSVVRNDGTLDRNALARLAFDPSHPRVDELNEIIHPAVIAEQARVIAALDQTQPDAIVVVESALIFSTKYGGSSWRDRFDCMVVVESSDEMKVRRFVDRMASGRQLTVEERARLEADARRRLAEQRHRATMNDSPSVFVVSNDGSLSELQAQVDALWQKLVRVRQAKTV